VPLLLCPSVSLLFRASDFMFVRDTLHEIRDTNCSLTFNLPPGVYPAIVYPALDGTDPLLSDKMV
jgi:hypothetical protein